MNASIFRTVKPGARVAVVDFAPNDGPEAKDPKDRAAGKTHGVTGDTVRAELERAGFEFVKLDQIGDRKGFLVLMRKPGGGSSQ
jgi:predicted methyltransferase